MTFKVGTVTRATSAESTPAPAPRGRRAQARYEEEKRRQKEAVDMLEASGKENYPFPSLRIIISPTTSVPYSYMRDGVVQMTSLDF